MRHEGSPHLETSGYGSEKPARIVLQNGETFDAAHHFKTETERWVCVYEDRSGGIDYRIPLSSVLYIDTSDVSIGEEGDETSTSAVSTQSEESSPVAAAFAGDDR